MSSGATKKKQAVEEADFALQKNAEEITPLVDALNENEISDAQDDHFNQMGIEYLTEAYQMCPCPSTKRLIDLAMGAFKRAQKIDHEDTSISKAKAISVDMHTRLLRGSEAIRNALRFGGKQ